MVRRWPSVTGVPAGSEGCPIGMGRRSGNPVHGNENTGATSSIQGVWGGGGIIRAQVESMLQKACGLSPGWWAVAMEAENSAQRRNMSANEGFTDIDDDHCSDTSQHSRSIRQRTSTSTIIDGNDLILDCNIAEGSVLLTELQNAWGFISVWRLFTEYLNPERLLYTGADAANHMYWELPYPLVVSLLWPHLCSAAGKKSLMLPLLSLADKGSSASAQNSDVLSTSLGGDNGYIYMSVTATGRLCVSQSVTDITPSSAGGGCAIASHGRGHTNPQLGATWRRRRLPVLLDAMTVTDPRLRAALPYATPLLSDINSLITAGRQPSLLLSISPGLPLPLSKCISLDRRNYQNNNDLLVTSDQACYLSVISFLKYIMEKSTQEFQSRSVSPDQGNSSSSVKKRSTHQPKTQRKKVHWELVEGDANIDSFDEENSSSDTSDSEDSDISTEDKSSVNNPKIDESSSSNTEITNKTQSSVSNNSDSHQEYINKEMCILMGALVQSHGAYILQQIGSSAVLSPQHSLVPRSAPSASTPPPVDTTQPYARRTNTPAASIDYCPHPYPWLSAHLTSQIAMYYGKLNERLQTSLTPSQAEAYQRWIGSNYYNKGTSAFVAKRMFYPLMKNCSRLTFL